MSPKIPLLRLPLLPFEKILDSLNLKDLIELSLLSEKLYDRVHSSQIVKLNDVKMKVEVMGCYDEVHLKSDSRGIFLVSTMRSDREVGCLESWYTKERYVEDDEKGIPIFQMIDWDRKNRKNDLFFWVQYLKKFFHVNSFDSLFFWPQGPSDIDKLFKKDDLLRNAERIYVTGGPPMSHEDTEFLLDNLSAEYLKLEVPLEDAENFQYNKKIRFSHLAMPNLSWLSEEQLLDQLTTTRKIEVKNSPVLTESFLNKFLKQWFNSSNETLQEFQIWSKPYANPSEIPVFDKKKVLEGITGTIMTDFMDDDPEEQGLDPGMTISRDRDTAMTIQVTNRGNALFFQCTFRDWRRFRV